MSEQNTAEHAASTAAAQPGLGQILREGLWDNNVVLSQMLGMCPALAVTSSATNGLGMGLATTAVLTVSNMLIAGIRDWVSPTVRIPIFIAVIAGMVTLVDIALNAWMHELYKVLGIFIALIVVNCAVLGRAEAFASRHGVLISAFDGIASGLGFTLALVVMGAVREVLGAGTLFANAHLLLGEHFSFLEMRVLPERAATLFMILPPGGFLVVGMLIALRRQFEMRQARAASSPAGAAAEA